MGMLRAARNAAAHRCRLVAAIMPAEAVGPTKRFDTDDAFHRRLIRPSARSVRESAQVHQQRFWCRSSPRSVHRCMKTPKEGVAVRRLDENRYAISVDQVVRYVGSQAECERRAEILVQKSR